MAQTVGFHVDNLVTKDYLDARFSKFESRIEARFSQQDLRIENRLSGMDMKLNVIIAIMAITAASVVPMAIRTFFAT